MLFNSRELGRDVHFKVSFNQLPSSRAMYVWFYQES